MDDIVNQYWMRKGAGENPHALRYELLQREKIILYENGYEPIQDDTMSLTVGKWNLAILAANTRRAREAGKPTPLEELRGCEIAAVYVVCSDMENKGSQTALRAAHRGESPTGVLLLSAVLEKQLKRHEAGTKESPDAVRPRRTDGGEVLATFKL